MPSSGVSKFLYNNAQKSLLNVCYDRPLEMKIAIKRSRRHFLYDYDNGKYLDLSLNQGFNIFGHNPAFLTKSIKNAISLLLTSTGFPSKFEHQLLKEIHSIFPGIHHILLLTHYNEALINALKIARQINPNTIYLCFDGLIQQSLERVVAPSGLDILVHKLPFNDIAALETYGHSKADKIGAIILDPLKVHPFIKLHHPDFVKSLISLSQQFRIPIIRQHTHTTLDYPQYQDDPKTLCMDILGPQLSNGQSLWILGLSEKLSHWAEENDWNQNDIFSSAQCIPPYVLATAIKTLQKWNIEKNKDQREYWINQLKNTLPEEMILSYFKGFFYFSFILDIIDTRWEYQNIAEAYQENYKRFVKHCFSQGIIIPPNMMMPLTISLNFGEIEFKWLAKRLKKAYEQYRKDKL